jgi:hypothetical protein
MLRLLAGASFLVEKRVHFLLMRTRFRTMRSIPGLQLCFAHILIEESIGGHVADHGNCRLQPAER